MVRAVGGRSSSRLYRVSQGDEVDAKSAQFLSTLLFLRFYSFVDVFSLLLVFLRVFGIKGSLRLGGMPWLGFGRLCVVMDLVDPFLLFILGTVGFLLICMVFIGGCLTQLKC